MAKGDSPPPFRPCICIPVFNHEHAITETITTLEAFGVPCVAVDDGSTDGSSERIGELTRRFSWLTLERIAVNSGKGAAILRGVQWARDRGYSHLLCIDADGQHCSADVPHFLKLASDHPAALVLAQPKFSTDAPLARRLGRELSNVLMWIQTRSFKVRDVLCGFRVYPIWLCGDLMLREVGSLRMAFDLEVLVRLCWSRVPVMSLESRVSYPRDGVSHFHYLRDNISIAGMHARLLLGMLLRLPRGSHSALVGE